VSAAARRSILVSGGSQKVGGQKITSFSKIPENFLMTFFSHLFLVIENIEQQI